MFERLIRFAIEQRMLVMLATLAMAVLGLASLARLPIDAVPDITNVQVQVNTAWPGASPLEAEQRLTYPIETAMAGLPGLVQTRSLSRYGLSQVTVIFRDGTSIHFARQLVAERLQQAREQLPAGASPQLGPIATGLGEIYSWTVEAEPGAKQADGSAYSAADLRDIQDWVIKPQLRTVPGVTEVNTIGGEPRTLVVAPRPELLMAHGLTLADVVQALQRRDADVGAGYIERQGEQVLVRVPGRLRDAADVGAVALKAAGGVALRLRDVAEIAEGQPLRSGAATDNGREVVLGTVFMLMGENSRNVAAAVGARMDEIARSLPPGVHAIPVYDRTRLVDRAIATVQKNLFEGAALVIAVLFACLGNLRAALITGAVIPLSMLFTFTGMVGQRVSANLMSLGALDFGIIVDGAVVIVENAVRRLAHLQASLGRALTREERRAEVFAAAREVRRPLLFGQAIIIVVYLPVFALTGVEGRMFHPMAFTVVAALLGAMLLSVTFVPAALALFIGERVVEREPGWLQRVQRAYAGLLERALAAPAVVGVSAGVAVALAAAMAMRLGSEFVPTLNEGDFAVQALRPPGTSLTQSVAMQQQTERLLMARFPEIERVFARTGTAEIAADPMPPNISDAYVMLKPRSEWPEVEGRRRTRDELREAITQALAGLPGQNLEFSQPIQLRFNELISGVRSDVAVKLFGDDLALLQREAARVAQALQGVRGAAEVRVEQTSGQPVLTVDIDRELAARHGLSVDAIQETVAIATGGREAGTLFRGDRRMAVLVRLPEASRSDPAALARLPLALPGGAGYVPLASVATLRTAPGPAQVSRENGQRRVVVSANVRGRDLGSFVADAQAAVARLQLPAGTWASWGGQYENLQSAASRLALIVPAALALVFALLYAMFGRVRDGLLVFTGIPFALSGGVAALWLRGMPLSISAGVGFIALSGVAVLNGLVMLSRLQALREEGLGVEAAVREGAASRLRAVLMTALVASLGFVPMALATGTGAEVQRPLATVVIGGILSSTALTLVVLPVLYRWAAARDRSLLRQA